MKSEINNPELILNKPEPISIETELYVFSNPSDLHSTIRTLQNGKHVLIQDFYSDGLLVLNELQAILHKKHPNTSFLEQRQFRAEYRRMSNLVLARVKAHKINLKKAPSIGWFEILYPEIADFLLPFPQIQGLNSSWQWYKNGILIPVLRNKIHPYYGVYFPTRFEHLILFDNWLKHYEGPKKSAIDVGIGSGVLSFLLMKHGFQKSFGTDFNPNAIIGLNESMKDTKLARKIEIDCGDLFGKWEKPTELIVFNPPWLPASYQLNRLDEAIYYSEELFPNFFEEAKKRLLPDGQLVLFFSNLAQITELSADNPIEKELLNGNRFELVKCYKKSVKEASDKTRRNQNWRAEEAVELWVLKHKQ